MVDSKAGGTIGMIVIFSFVSIIFVFMTMLIVGSLNNYALGELLDISSSFLASGIIPPSFDTVANDIAANYAGIIDYLDFVWFGSFISLVASSMIFSYFRKRESYFSLLNMSVLGIMIFTYFGGIIIDLTYWFRAEVLLSVFPTLTSKMPIFSWYLDNLAIINLIIIVINIIINFVDFDLSKFNRRKEGESFDEI